MIADDRTASLLWAGVAGPILFIAVFLAAGVDRAGYDPVRHPVSLLSLGGGGWIQIASFLVTGVLLLAFAVGLRTSLGGGFGARGAPLALAVSGLGFLVAGAFSTQPLFGYPPGAPEGMATDVTAASVLHVIGAALLFFGLVAGALVLARRFRVQGSRGWSAASLAVAIVVLVLFAASGGGPSGQLLFPNVAGLLQRISLITGLGWVVAVALSSLQARSR